MIKLPDNWKDGIQLRDWMSPVNNLGQVVILVLVLKNKDGQEWMYQENNEEYPYKSSSFVGVDTFSTSGTVITDESDKAEILKGMYDRMVYHIPAISVLQDTVINYRKAMKYEPVTNDEWEIMPLPGLTFYKEKS